MNKSLLCVLALSSTLLPASAQTIRKVGEERAYALRTPADYPRGGADRAAVWSERVFSPGARFVRVHFAKFSLPPGDYVSVASPDGAQFWVYDGQGLNGTGEFWSFAVESDTALVTLHSGDGAGEGPSKQAYGFAVDAVAHGTEALSGPGDALAPEPDVVCGSDGRRNAACFSTVNTRPVARLLFQSGGSSFVCTGWLAAGSNANTMVTNNHCFTTQSEVNTVQAKFNYQTTTCTGTTTATTTDYAGNTLLRTSSSLDYTLFTLGGNPEATWGEYTATRKTATTGLTINFPQHPGGGLKRVALYENSGQTTRCTIALTGQSYGYASGSQVAYGCDSEGGSSGSPIMDAGTGRIIALHHLGGVSNAPCLNAATTLARVCTDAGTLLSCATN